MKKVHFATLGCKTNQYETQAMREKFLSAGYMETADPKEADLFVINTCTVTGEGDRKSREVIRRMHRENLKARIAVTGCYAVLNAHEIALLPGVAFVVPNDEKDQIVRRVSLDDIGNFCGEGDESEGRRYSDLAISYFADHARAFLKIQDGCDHRCTYCKVVIVRGSSRSRPLEAIVEEATRLVQNGYREIVLTGIQLGAYGDKWKSGVGLATVLEALIKLPGLERVRLSSIDPSDVTEELMECMRDHSKVCPHLHLPLQSGDDTVLKRMKRAYRRNHYLRIVGRLRELIPSFALTTDVMVGFPGEDEEHFQNTVEVLKRTRPLKVHVFPFSAREGTPAVHYRPRVSASILRERVRRLTAIGEELAQSFQSQFVGIQEEVLVESRADEDFLEGHTGNYLRVRVPADSAHLGEILRVQLLELRGHYFLGTAVTI